MAAALMELSEVLRSKADKEKITTSEKFLINDCMVKSTRNFFIGAFVSSAIVYRATRRLGNWYSFYLSAGSAMLIGRLVIDRSANACLEQILSLEGSRIQRELANIILWKYRENSSRIQLVHKHFYPEAVFTDLKPDKPLIMLRARNVYEDWTASQNAEHSEDSSEDADAETHSFQKSMTPQGKLGDVNTIQCNAGGDFLADPLDCLFGDEDLSGEALSDETTEIVGRQRRGRRWGRRRNQAAAQHA